MNLIVILIIVAIVVVWPYVSIFNDFIRLQQKTKEAWSGIDIQLKKRYNLIPNLVETVKGYATHEKSTFTDVTKARTEAIKVPLGSVAKQAAAENFLSQTLRSIMALSESYPDLKANQNFLKLQEDLEEAESQIAAARRIYNGNVTDLNTKVESFPSNLIAWLHKFRSVEYFELPDGEKELVRKVPKVKI